MTDYRRALENLDAKAGHIHTLSDCSLAFQKSVNTPEDLNDRDYVLIGFVHGERGVSEARARQMATTAALAAAQAQLTKALPPAPVVTTSVKTEDDPKTFDEFVRRHGTKSVNYLVLGAAVDVLLSALKRHKDRSDLLEQANKDLANRVLELEAKDAAHLVVVR